MLESDYEKTYNGKMRKTLLILILFSAACVGIGIAGFYHAVYLAAVIYGIVLVLGILFFHRGNAFTGSVNNIQNRELTSEKRKAISLSEELKDSILK